MREDWVDTREELADSKVVAHPGPVSLDESCGYSIGSSVGISSSCSRP
jgi:hypothetical protein